MASVTKYQTPKGVRWRVQYTDPTRKRRTKTGFITKKQAEHWAAENIIERNTGSWIDPQKQLATVANVHEKWSVTLATAKPSYRRQNELNWRNHVKPRWGDVALRDITSHDIQEWVLSIDRAPSTVRHLHAQLSAILSYAVTLGMLHSNPAAGVTLPKVQKRAKVYLTPQQLDLFVSCCNEKADLALLLGTTGLRWGEAVALRPKDIDFARRRITISRTAVSIGSRVSFNAPKTGEVRTVTAPQRTFDALAESCAGKKPGELIWTARDGGALRTVTGDSWWTWALKRAQDKDPDFPRITPHSLRHVAAGLLVGAGASVKAVQRQLGHATAAMTLDTYAELFDGDLDEVADALDEMFS